MQTPQRSALIVGATGLVGSEVLDRLLNNDLYDKVIAISRKPLAITHTKLESLEANFDELAVLAPAAFRVDDVFCCLGTTLKTAGSKPAFEAVDYGHVVSVAELCLEQGANRFFLVSAVGANPKSSNFYSQVKGRTEVAVSKLAFSAVYWIRPSLLLGKRQEYRAGEAWAQRLAPMFSPLLAGPLRQFRPVTAADVADHIMQLAAVESLGQHITYPSHG